MINRLKFLLVFVFLMQSTLVSSEIAFESIEKDSYFIQVGAFRSISNIDKVIVKLSDYNVYLEPYKNLHRVHVVNITKNRLKIVLKKIRRLYPKSFIVKRAIYNDRENSENSELSSSNVEQNSKLFETLQNNIKIIQPNHNILDTNSIIRTRKSFL